MAYPDPLAAQGSVTPGYWDDPAHLTPAGLPSGLPVGPLDFANQRLADFLVPGSARRLLQPPSPGGVVGGRQITQAEADAANAAARASGDVNHLPVLPSDFVFGKGLGAPPGAGQVDGASAKITAQAIPTTDPRAIVANMVAGGESANNPSPYTALYNPSRIANFDVNYPDLPGYLGFPQWPGASGPQGISHAAGKYQFEPDTWRQAALEYSQANPNQAAPNFRNPADQDKVFQFWAEKTYGINPKTGKGLLDDVKAGTFDKSRLAQQWPSLGPRESVGSTTAGLLSAWQTSQAEKQKLIEADIAQINEINKRLDALAPDSTERHRLLQDQLERSHSLQNALLERMRDAPQQKPTDLMSAFGSIAMLVAAIGGSRSRQPATASLNAAAGVFEGLHANNQEEYERNFKTWQAQTGILEKVIGIQNDDFRAVMENQRLDATERAEQITNLFRTYEMGHGVRLMEAGQIDQGYKIVEDMMKWQEELTYKHKQMDELDARIKEQQARAKYLSQGGAAGNKPQMFGVTTPDGNTDIHYGVIAEPGKLMDLGTGQVIDTSNARVTPYGTSTQGMLSEDSVKLNAQQYEMGDLGVITALPRGGPARIQVENQIAKDLRDMPDAARGVVMNRIRMKEAEAAARTAGRVTMNTELFAQEAVGAGQQVIDTSKKFSRTNLPLVNAALAAYETNTGSPDVIRFGAAINALLNAYGKLSNPTGTGIHDADKERLSKILDTRLSQGQVEAAVDQIITEGRVVSNAAENAQRDVITKLAPTPVGAPTPTFSGNAPEVSKEQYDALPPGAPYRMPGSSTTMYKQ